MPGGDPPGDDGMSPPSNSQLLQSEVKLMLVESGVLQGPPSLRASARLVTYEPMPSVNTQTLVDGVVAPGGTRRGDCILEAIQGVTNAQPLEASAVRLTIENTGREILLRDTSIPKNGVYTTDEIIDGAVPPVRVSFQIQAGTASDASPALGDTSLVELDVPARFTSVLPPSETRLTYLQLRETVFAWGSALNGEDVGVLMETADRTLRLWCRMPDPGGLQISDATLDIYSEIANQRASFLHIFRVREQQVSVGWVDGTSTTTVSFRVEAGTAYTVSP